MSSTLSWADEGEDEILEAIQENTRIKELEQRTLFRPHVTKVKEILDSATEFCQIGLVLYMIANQKTINIFREGKEDREYEASLLMNKVQQYLHDNIETYQWTVALKYVCEDYEPTVKGDLIRKAKRLHINKEKVLSMRTLEKNLNKNKKIYRDRKNHDPLFT